MGQALAVSPELFEFNKLRDHIGHAIACVCYGDDENVWNVAVECEDCGVVLCDADNPQIEKDNKL